MDWAAILRWALVQRACRRSAQGLTYTLKGSGASQVLLISKDGGADGIRVQGWLSGQLGLAMSGAAASATPAVITGADGYSDGLTGTGSADRLLGLSGNDALNGGDGDDIVDGGLGDDYIDLMKLARFPSAHLPCATLTLNNSQNHRVIGIYN